MTDEMILQWSSEDRVWEICQHGKRRSIVPYRKREAVKAVMQYADKENVPYLIRHFKGGAKSPKP
jgi:hypothetical protein